MSKPQYVLKCWDRTRGKYAKTVCGSGWLQDDGSIAIQLNPCITLQYGENLSLILFPKDFDNRDDYSKDDDSSPILSAARKK